MKVENEHTPELLEAGKVVNTHGVRGNLKLESWCDSPAVLTSLRTVYFKKKSGTAVAVNVCGGFTHKGYAVLALDGISDMDTALRYKGAIVYARREDIPLPEGSYFVRDLIGLPVIDAESGARYGVTHDYISGAAQDMYEVLLDPELCTGGELSNEPSDGVTTDGESADGDGASDKADGTSVAELRRRLRYVPAVPQFIDRVELGKGIFIRVPDGLFD